MDRWMDGSTLFITMGGFVCDSSKQDYRVNILKKYEEFSIYTHTHTQYNKIAEQNIFNSRQLNNDVYSVYNV